MTNTLNRPSARTRPVRPGEPTAPNASTMLSVLQGPTFRKLFAAQVIALIGTGLLTVALGLLAFDIAGDAAGAVLGTVLTIKMVAYVGLSPVISAVAAHIPRKPLLIGADLVRVGIAACLLFVTQTWQIYVLIFILQSASAAFTPAFQSTIPAILPEERDYTKALSLSRLAYDLESVVSPMLAAALLMAMSFHNLFVGTALGFAISALLVARTVLPAAPMRAESPFRERLTCGVRLMFGRRELRGIQGINLAVAAVQSMVIVNTVVLVRAYLDRPQSDVAVLLGAFGAGSMLVALAMPRLSRTFRDFRLMLAGATAAVALLGVFGLAVPSLADAPSDPTATTSWALVLVVWLVLGAAVSLMLTPLSKVIAGASTESTRPALFAAQFSLSHACFLVTYPLAGLAGSVSGLSETCAILVGVGALGVAIAARNR